MMLFAFFELRQLRLLRWTSVLLLLGLGVGLFLRNMNDLRSFGAGVYLSVVLTAVGGALGIYGICLKNGRFYSWRSRKARRRSACGPGYAKDVFLLALILTVVISLGMAWIWPTACGLMPLVLTLICGQMFLFVLFYEKYALK